MKQNWLAAMATTYAIACACPAFGAPGQEPIYGWQCLVEIPYVIYFPAWYANPLFLVGCEAMGRGHNRVAAWLGVTATVLAASFGVYAGLEPLKIGFLLWLVSMILLATAGFWCHRRRRVGMPAHDSAPAEFGEPGSSSTSGSSASLSSRSPS